MIPRTGRRVYVHGLNKISIDRGKMIVDVQVPFEKTDITFLVVVLFGIIGIYVHLTLGANKTPRL